MSMKERRQQEILNLIQEQDLEVQEDLLEKLRDRGFNCTQATISRDIKELHLVKERSKNGTYKYVVSLHRGRSDVTARLKTIFRESVLSFEAAQNLIILKTMPGLASAAGAALDSMEIPNLVGSIAGDDTCVLIMRTNGAAEQLCSEIHLMMK